MRRTASLLRAGAASAALALLLIGVPALLITAVGWPLPRHLPTVTTIGDTLTGHQPLETTTVWKVLAVILWLAWLQIVIAAIVEAIASARGALPNTIPGFNLAHGLVAPLIAAVVLSWPAATTTGRAAAAPAPIVEPVHATVDTPTAPPPSNAPSDAPAPATVEHVVQRRDTLWDLAERYLGDGYRSREIFELNRGRPQPDGGTLTDPGVIRPGWTLEMPAGPTPADPSARSVTVQPGDTLWDIAERELGNPRRFDELVDLNRDVSQPDGATLVDPQLVQPGWVLQLPPTDATPAADAVGLSPSPDPDAPAAPTLEQPTTEEPVISPTTTSAPSQSERVHPPEAADADESQLPLAPFGLVGGGIATAGLLTLLERRRRAQLRRRDKRQVPPFLTPELQAADAALHAGANLASAAALDTALRVSQVGGGLDGLRSVDQLEARDGSVVFTTPDNAADAVGLHDDGPQGCNAESDDHALLSSDTASPAPLLVPIGVDVGGRTVLVDLESPALTTITGDRSSGRRLLNSIAVAAATSTWADHSHVLYVGTPPITLDELDTAPSIEQALNALEARARRAADALDAADFATVAEARAAGIAPDLWTPLVVIVPDHPDPTAFDRLSKFADEQPACVAVVICSDEPLPGRVIDVDADGAASIDGGRTIAAHLLADAELAKVAELIDLTEAPCVPAPELAAAHRPWRRAAAGESALDELLGEVDVLIRVLGEIEAVRIADGQEERLKAPKQKSLEALTYLALREERVDREDLQAALWPAGDNSTKTFHNTIWAARKMLTDIGSPELFPEPTEGHYVLGDGIATDYELFHELAARAEEAEDPDAAADLLAEALTLVRGEPFTGVGRSYSWAAPHAGVIVAQVVDAAEELGEIRLAAGDWRGAEWAARQGLLVFPCDERLYRLLMRAAHASGNIPGVHRAFDELAAVVADPDDGVEPDDTLHPETVTLLEDLTGSRPRVDRATA